MTLKIKIVKIDQDWIKKLVDWTNFVRYKDYEEPNNKKGDSNTSNKKSDKNKEYKHQ